MGRRCCQSCGRWFDLGGESRFLLVYRGNLIITRRAIDGPASSDLPFYSLAVAACGQMCTLILTERYVERQSFAPAQLNSSAA